MTTPVDPNMPDPQQPNPDPDPDRDGTEANPDRETE